MNRQERAEVLHLMIEVYDARTDAITALVRDLDYGTLEQKKLREALVRDVEVHLRHKDLLLRMYRGEVD